MSQPPPPDARNTTDIAPDEPSPPEAEIVEDRCSSLPWWGILLLAIATAVTVVFLPCLGIFGVPTVAYALMTSKRTDMAGLVLAVGGAAIFALATYINCNSDGLRPDFFLFLLVVMPGVVFCTGAAIVFLYVARKYQEKRLQSILGVGVAILIPVLWFTAVEPVTTRSRVERVSHPTSPDDFPYDLRELLDVAQRDGIGVEPIDVFCVSSGFYEEYYWQTAASPELLQWSTEEWRLVPLERESEKLQYFWERMPAEWHVPQTDEMEYFVSTDWCYTEYGTILMHDKANGRFYFWYMSNF